MSQASAARKKPSEMSVEEQMADVSRQVSDRYAARCWWADRDDLFQQAYSVCLEVLRKYPPKREDGSLDRKLFGGFCWRACMRQLSRYLWRQSSIVSATDHETKDLGGKHSVPIEGGCYREGHPQGGVVLVDPSESAETLYTEAQLLALVQHRIGELCGVDPWMRAVLRVLLENKTPATVAAEEGLPKMALSRHVEWAKSRIREDDRMVELAGELAELRQRRSLGKRSRRQ